MTTTTPPSGTRSATNSPSSSKCPAHTSRASPATCAGAMAANLRRRSRTVALGESSVTRTPHACTSRTTRECANAPPRAWPECNARIPANACATACSSRDIRALRERSSETVLMPPPLSLLLVRCCSRGAGRGRRTVPPDDGEGLGGNSPGVIPGDDGVDCIPADDAGDEDACITAVNCATASVSCVMRACMSSCTCCSSRTFVALTSPGDNASAADISSKSTSSNPSSTTVAAGSNVVAKVGVFKCAVASRIAADAASRAAERGCGGDGAGVGGRDVQAVGNILLYVFNSIQCNCSARVCGLRGQQGESCNNSRKKGT
ncbi:hypothetical protein BC828DRAFT_372605 [Blastocladiella britannica]|nr:hypothetical protein BC828DRAFT_372605 [Blastocladiella britannica]